MKIAVTHENGQIFGHFGHTEQFQIYTEENRRRIGSEVVDTNGSGHGALSGLFSVPGVDALIAACLVLIPTKNATAAITAAQSIPAATMVADITVTK